MNRCNDIRPLSSKGALNSMANRSIYPYYFSENKGIREKCEGDALLLRGLSKNKGLTTVAKTSFLPHSTNKTTSVAGNAARTHQPYYLIKNEVNEVIRSKILCETSMATVVVLSGKLGGNKVKPLSSKGALNRMANTNTYPYYFSENKGTKRSDLTKVIREEYEGGALLLRGHPKIRGYITPPIFYIAPILSTSPNIYQQKSSKTLFYRFLSIVNM